LTSQGGNSHGAPRALARTLGFLDLTLLGISASIGSGVFVLSGVVLKAAGPGVVIAFVIASFVVFLDALCYAELAGRFQVAGGAYMFTTKILGPRYGLLVGANIVFDSHVGNAAIARSFAGYVEHFVAGIPVRAFHNIRYVAPDECKLASDQWQRVLEIAELKLHTMCREHAV